MTDADTIRLLGLLAHAIVPGIVVFFMYRHGLNRGYDAGYRDGLRHGREDAAKDREAESSPPEDTSCRS
jgi:threonine/homoserine/homoserine lactone efflux protein